MNINTSMNVNSSVPINDSVNYVEICNKFLELEAELIKQYNMVENDEYNRLSKNFSKLEQHCISLELAIQLNKEIFQKNNTSINQTKPSFDQLFELNNLKAELQAKDTTIEKLKENIKRLNKTSTTNNVIRYIDEIETINIELEHRAKEHAESLVNQLNQKSVEITNFNAQLLEKVFVITTLKNNLRKFKGKDIVDNAAQVETHIYYLKHTMEQAAILKEIVEQAKSLNLLDSVSYFAYKYVKLIQELLGYVRDTFHDTHKPSEKLVAVTPINKRKTVRIDEPVISSSTSQKKLGSSQTKTKQTTNNSMSTSIGVSRSTKSSSSMFDARHELYFLEFVFDMNASSKSNSVKKAKNKEEWKPTGKVFTKIGYNQRPTGRTFTLVGNACPLTRITATNKVPLREPIPLEVVAQESVVTKVYTRRPKGSNTLVAPSSSVDLRLHGKLMLIEKITSEVNAD
ncbi:hypothetical protein Tco_1483291 [Tanacetum coccineum]